MQSSKLKTLLIYTLLEKYSDLEHPISTTDLIEKLKDYGIFCERKSIYSDITALNEIGYEIEMVTSPKRGFYMAKRRFQLPEVRLLIDAVTSAGFITPKKTESLVENLESLLSVYESDSLKSQVYCESENKCDNEEIYYIIDNLHEAIINKVKVQFTYKRRSIDKKNKKNYTNKSFIVSPYALIWKQDHYYLICNNDKYDNLMNLRLDRMKKIEMTEEKSRPFEEVCEYKGTFDSADYSSKMYNMFSGKEDNVTLCCHLDLREQIMDQFGNSIPLTAVDEDHFKTTITPAISDGFISWVLQYGDKIKVIEPEYLVNNIKKRLKDILNVYN